MWLSQTIVELVRDCMNDEPSQRPSFQQIIEKLEPFVSHSEWRIEQTYLLELYYIIITEKW